MRMRCCPPTQKLRTYATCTRDNAGDAKSGKSRFCRQSCGGGGTCPQAAQFVPFILWADDDDRGATDNDVIV